MAGRSEPIRQALTRLWRRLGIVQRWVAGTSIGAINAAIIAGNQPEQRVPRLRAFWDRVSGRLLGMAVSPAMPTRAEFSMRPARLFPLSGGVPGFFEPRIPPAVVMPQGTTEAISVYDTEPLRATLLELVDFDLLNSGSVRLSIGAVQVLTGNMQYFDSASQTIGPEHVMASGALPPGFPRQSRLMVSLIGMEDWFPTRRSNTCSSEVVRARICASSRWTSSAPEAACRRRCSMWRSGKRRSATRAGPGSTPMYFRELQTIRRAIRHLRTAVPQELRDNPDWRFLDSVSCNAAITIVLLIHRRAAYWTQSSDYEFSRYTIEEHWEAGRADVERTLRDPAWKNRTRPEEGVMVLDLTRELDADPKERDSMNVGEVRKSRLCHAADQPRFSAGAVPLRRSRVSHHHLQNRSGRTRSGGARAAHCSTQPHRQV